MKYAALTLLALLLVLGASPSEAKIRVFADGTGDYPDIQTALYAAAEGDTIELFNGVFTGPGNRNLEFTSQVLLKSRFGYSTCIIDCESQGRGFNLTEETGGTIEGVTVRGGQAADGAVAVTGWGAYIFEDCLFQDNHATDRGGVWYGTDMGNVNFRGCIFLNNTAGNQGGALMAEGATGLGVQFCTLFRNEAGSGSAVYLGSDALADIENTIMAFNRGGSAFAGYYFAGADFACSDLYANEGGDWVNGASGLGVNGNISQDPMLMDPMAPNPDLRLTTNSPCRATATACGEAMGAAGNVISNQPRYGVSPDGQGMFPTLSAAFASGAGLQENAVVVLEDGTYFGDDSDYITFDGVSLESRSGDPEACIIDFTGKPDTFIMRSFNDTVPVRVKGITLAGTGQINYSIVHVSGGVEMTFQDCIIRDHFSASADDVPFEFWSTDKISFLNCRFLDNIGDHDLPLIEMGGPASDEVQFVSCEFSGNRTGGTLIQVEDVELLMNNTTIENNMARGMVSTRNNQARCYNLEFAANTSVEQAMFDIRYGDLIYMYGSVHDNTSSESPVRAYRSVGRFETIDFTNNSTDGIYSAGALALDMSDMQVRDCRFENNYSDRGIGALHAEFDDSDITIEADLLIQGCTFTGNIAGVGAGALRVTAKGLETSYSGNHQDVNLDLVSCTFDRNEASASFHSQVQIETWDDGGSAQPTGSIDLDVNQCLITNATFGNGISAELNLASTSTINCTNIHGNQAGDWNDPVLGGHFAAISNISVDPLYCDGPAGDLTLQDNSPCLPENNVCNAQIGAEGEGCTAGVSSTGDAPIALRTGITGNHPNPFNPRTLVSFDLAEGGPASLLVYDVSGRLVRTLIQGEVMASGRQEVLWDGYDDQGQRAAAGIYLARLQAGGRQSTHKMIMIK